MPRKKKASLTDREAQIMDVLWRQETATAEEVRSLLPDAPHDSTVRTLLRVMEQKGLVCHEVQQRTFVYRARIVRSQARQKALRGLLKQLFGGSVRSLVLQLLDDEEITPAELERLAREEKPDSGNAQKRGKS